MSQEPGASAPEGGPTRSPALVPTRPRRVYVVTAFLPREARHRSKRPRSLVVECPRHHGTTRRGKPVSSLFPYGAYMAMLYAVICALLLLGPWNPWGGLAVVVLAAALALCSAVVVGRGMAPPTWKDEAPSGGQAPLGALGAARPFGALAIQLTPLAVLAVVFPLVGDRLHALTVGGTPFSILILAGSVAVPLLAQVACAPLYRVLGEEVYDKGSSALKPSFLSYWPSVFCRAITLVVLLCVTFGMTAHWSIGAVLAFGLFLLNSLAMVQWFVVPIMERRYELWAGAWIAYAAVLLFAPQLCFVAPLAAWFVLIFWMLRRPIFFPLRTAPNVWRAFAQGSVQGTLIWLNPLLLLLVSGDAFRPTDVFLSLLPAIILFNAYFTMIAPGLQFGFDSFQHALDRAGVEVLRAQAEHLRAQVRGKFVALGVSVVVALTLTIVIEILNPVLNTSLYNAMVICSVGFCLEAIFVYSLVQLKRQRLAIGVSAVHCAVFVAAMLTWGPTAAFYAVNGAVEVLLVAVLAFVYTREIAEPHYALFWGHATAW